MECRFCGYNWKPRKDQPKSCPRCKRRFDYPERKDPLLKAKEFSRGFERNIYVMAVLTKELKKIWCAPGDSWRGCSGVLH
jgi:predicted amidophosphoribosyltransferase